MAGRKRTRAAARASVQDSPTEAEQLRRKPKPTRKRKVSDLDHFTSAKQEAGTSPTKTKVPKLNPTQPGKTGYTGPYPQHLRPTPAECQVGESEAMVEVGAHTLRTYGFRSIFSQAARDGLAALHGDPKRAALGEEKFELAEQAANSETQTAKKESWQRSVLDSLVRLQHLIAQ